MNEVLKVLGEARKFLVGAASAAGVILSTGLAHGNVETVLNIVLAFLGAVGVYAVPNAGPAIVTVPVAPPVVPPVA